MMTRILSVFCLIITQLIVAGTAAAQNTVGLLSLDPINVSDAYTLMFPHNQGNVYLLNNCGEIVHVWNDPVYRPGNSVYLNSAGDLYRCYGQGAASNQWIHAGGGGEGIDIRDWDGNLLWQWAYNDSTVRLHHDIAVMPNGNILAIAWERKSWQEAIDAGRDSALLTEGEIWPDRIIEIEPVFPDSANIVWQWNAWDHLVQDYDQNQDNFGIVGDHPELINVNFGPDKADWMHSNAIDYNPFWDQIMISVPEFNEIWIIDHSTTTQQASGHTGGLSGMGGDLVFRWGNPQAYNMGDSTDQKLFYQHDSHWIDIGLNSANPDFGKIMVFNNQVGEDFSRVEILNPIFDSYKGGFPMSGGTFLPSDFEWSYQRPDSTNMHSTGLSSAQRLANGNTLVCVGRYGYTFEIDENENIVWEYKTPLLGGNPVSQGANLGINQNLTFKANKYSQSYFPNLVEADFEPIGYIELDPDTNFCSTLVGVPSISSNQSETLLFPNPTSGLLNFKLNKAPETCEIYDLAGKSVLRLDGPMKSSGAIDVSGLKPGVYFVRLGASNISRICVVSK